MPGKDYKLGIKIEAYDTGVGRKLREINNELNHAFVPARRFALTLRDMARDSGLARVAQGVIGVKQALGGVVDAAETVAFRFAAIGGVAGGALFAVIKSAADAGDAAYKASQRIGISVESYQRLAHAAKLADVDTEALGSSLGKLNKNIVGAATGNKEMAVWFARAGISVRDNHGKLKDAEVIVGKLADKFARMKDGPAKAALAMGLFGKSGAAMIPLLNAGSKGLREAAREAEHLGLVISRKDAMAAEEFNDNLTRLGSSVQGLRNSIGNALIPVFGPMVTRLTEWVAANRELVATRVVEFVNRVVAVLPRFETAITTIWHAVNSLWDNLKAVHDLFGSWKPLLIGVGLVLAGPLLSAVVGAGSAFVGLGVAVAGFAITVGVALGPLTAAAAAIGVIVANWEKVKSFGSWVSSPFLIRSGGYAPLGPSVSDIGRQMYGAPAMSGAGTGIDGGLLLPPPSAQTNTNNAHVRLTLPPGMTPQVVSNTGVPLQLDVGRSMAY